MAEFHSVGAQCSYPSCRQLDFLPIKCNHCQKLFCSKHSFPESHECPEFTSSIGDLPTAPGPSLYVACEVRGCKEKEMTRITCPHCQLTTCLNHRHPKDHDCPSMVQRQNPLAGTQEHIKSLTTNTEVKRRKPKSEKAKKTMARVQLMKLKMKSVGEKSIPTDNRVYFRVLRPNKGPIGVFVSKDWSMGRALDSIAQFGEMPNKNNDATESEKLLLFHSDDGSPVVPMESMSLTLEGLLQQNEIINGETLIIDYSSSLLSVDPSKYADA